jgi:hypothetical protein
MEYGISVVESFQELVAWKGAIQQGRAMLENGKFMMQVLDLAFMLEDVNKKMYVLRHS